MTVFQRALWMCPSTLHAVGSAALNPCQLSVENRNLTVASLKFPIKGDSLDVTPPALSAHLKSAVTHSLALVRTLVNIESA